MRNFADDSRRFQDEASTTLKRIYDSAEERGRESKRFSADSTVFQVNSAESLKRLEENVSKMVSTQPIQVAGAAPMLAKEQNQKVLDSLEFDQIDARQVSIRKAHAKTCKWVLEHRSYKDWLDSEKLSQHCGFIWIKGKPGAGKSTLMKFLLVQAQKKKKCTIVISFFFHARGGDLEKSTVGMYRSLLFQLLTQRPELQDSCGSIVKTIFHGDRYEWGLEPLKTLTQEIILHLSQSPLVIFIDALDECDEDEIRDMISFFSSLGELATSKQIQLRVCFSSRYYPYIKIAKGLELLLEGEEGHARDIVAYVDSELKIGQNARAQLLRAEIERKARGVFMWVVLVVGILNKEFSHGNIHKLRQRLRDIPGDLHALFRSILSRDDERKDELLRCIQWVLFSKEPLKPEQLYLAVFSGTEPEMLCQYDPDDVDAEDIQRFLTSSSKGLVETTQSKIPTMQFIHESVKDFLLKENGLEEIWPDLGGDCGGKSHDTLKKCCLNHLRPDVLKSLEVEQPLPKASSEEGKELRRLTMRKFPFLEYAVSGVLYHANSAEAGGVSQIRFIQVFKLTSWVMLNNLVEQHEVRRYKETVSFLYVLAELNCASLISAYPMKQSCFEIEGSRYGPPLFAAFATQSKEAVSALLEAEAHSQPDNVLLQNLARKYATWEGSCMAISRGFKFTKESSLHFAAKSRDLEMYTTLFNIYELGIEDKNEEGDTRLMLAAWDGRKAFVELLIEMGAEVDGIGSFGRTPLHVAAGQGHDDIVRLLVTKGANLERRNVEDRTPLIVASQLGHEKTIMSLLALGANIEARTREGITPLIHACMFRNGNAARVLLGKGANIEAKSSDGRTPLIVASSLDHERIVGLLLEKGADIETKCKRGWTALMHASESGHHVIVGLLLENGAILKRRTMRVELH